MKCHECRELLSPYLDNMTSDEENQRITVHLATCSSCNKEMQELKLMLDGLKGLNQDVPVPSGFMEEMHERLLLHKTSLWGKRYAINAPRPGGWIAASLAALALGAGIWMSSFMSYTQVADLVQKTVPAWFQQDTVKQNVDKLVAQKTKEMDQAKGTATGGSTVTTAPQQVAVNTPNGASHSGTPATQGKTTTHTGTSTTVNNTQGKTSGTPATTVDKTEEQTPKIASVVAMQVEVKDLESAASFLQNEAVNRDDTIARADTVRTMSAYRTQVLNIQVPQDKVDDWTSLIQQLGKSSTPSSKEEDLTKSYYKLQGQIADLQQQIDSLSKQTGQEQTINNLKQQLAGYQKQMSDLNYRLNMVTITVVLKESITP